MSGKRATITTANGTKLVLDGYSVEDVRWMMRVQANDQPAQPPPSPKPEASAAVHRPQRPRTTGAVLARLPSIREGDYIEPNDNKGRHYFIVDVGGGRHKKVPYQVKGLFQCAYCDAVLTTPASRGGHERAHIKRGEAPKRQVVAMHLATADEPSSL